MNQNQIAAQYRQSSAQGAHPVGLVVRLYDAIVEDFRRAGEALQRGDVEKRTTALNHTLLIIAELESVLDHERGGQVARHLKGFYRVTRAMIVEANARSTSADIDRLMSLFLPVREAWQHAERVLTSGDNRTPADRERQAARAFREAAGDSNGTGWSV